MEKISGPQNIGSKGDDLYEHFRFVADKGQSPLRVDKYLMNKVENATRNRIQKSAKEGNIFVNDHVVKSNYKVKAHDVITVRFEHPPYEMLLTPEDFGRPWPRDWLSWLFMATPCGHGGGRRTPDHRPLCR